jgi:hypothetical protein
MKTAAYQRIVVGGKKNVQIFEAYFFPEWGRGCTIASRNKEHTMTEAIRNPDDASDLYLTMRRRIAESPLSYRMLEEKSGVPKRFIVRFKLGEIDELRTSHTLKLCKALGIKASFTVREQ